MTTFLYSAVTSYSKPLLPLTQMTTIAPTQLSATMLSLLKPSIHNFQNKLPGASLRSRHSSLQKSAVTHSRPKHWLSSPALTAPISHEMGQMTQLVPELQGEKKRYNRYFFSILSFSPFIFSQHLAPIFTCPYQHLIEETGNIKYIQLFEV